MLAPLLIALLLAQPTSPAVAPKKPAPPPAKDPLPLLKASPTVDKPFPARDLKDVHNTDKSMHEAVTIGLEKLLAMQEGDNKAEWPYEGVYRVNGQIPVGYRVGGTAIGALALSRAPGYDKDHARQDSLARAVAFVCKGIDHPLMSEINYDAGYDVRGWGYTYGLQLLSELKIRHLIPKGKEETCDAAAKWYLDAINKTAIPKNGGWNYARPAGRATVAGPSTFMTAPTLQALFTAKAAGYTVDEAVIELALTSLEKARNSTTKEIVYSGAARAGGADGVPGAMGRMCASETTLLLAGRGDIANVRNAVNQFITNWSWLDKRRQMPQTHEPPYMVAPYYFYYAHYFAAQAVEMLPEAERPPLREKINALLFSVRQPDNTWNDRIFTRTANFGTSFAVMSILAPELDKPATWTKPAAPAPKPEDQKKI